MPPSRPLPGRSSCSIPAFARQVGRKSAAGVTPSATKPAVLGVKTLRQVERHVRVDLVVVAPRRLVAGADQPAAAQATGEAGVALRPGLPALDAAGASREPDEPRPVLLRQGPQPHRGGAVGARQVERRFVGDARRRGVALLAGGVAERQPRLGVGRVVRDHALERRPRLGMEPGTQGEAPLHVGVGVGAARDRQQRPVLDRCRRRGAIEANADLGPVHVGVIGRQRLGLGQRRECFVVAAKIAQQLPLEERQVGVPREACPPLADDDERLLKAPRVAQRLDLVETGQGNTARARQENGRAQSRPRQPSRLHDARPTHQTPRARSAFVTRIASSSGMNGLTR